MSRIGQFEKFFKGLLNVSHLKKISIDGHRFRSQMVRYSVGKGNIIFHLRENIAKRLHHGLSETILVNKYSD